MAAPILPSVPMELRVNCPVCGTANEPDRKFCGECGSPLAATCPTCGSANAPGREVLWRMRSTDLRQAAASASTESAAIATAERRLVVVLFADLVGFTTLSRVARPRGCARAPDPLLRDGDARSSRAYGGTVEKFIGDAVMAVWGAPIAHEDDAERAVAPRSIWSTRSTASDVGATPGCAPAC